MTKIPIPYSMRTLDEETIAALRKIGTVAGAGDTATIEFTCVYPRPGCSIDALQPSWRARTRELVEKYNREAAADGLLRQGCCCGHKHRRLDDAEAQALRDAGFLIEHDTESLDEHDVESPDGRSALGSATA